MKFKYYLSESYFWIIMMMFLFAGMVMYANKGSYEVLGTVYISMIVGAMVNRIFQYFSSENVLRKEINIRISFLYKIYLYLNELDKNPNEEDIGVCKEKCKNALLEYYLLASDKNIEEIENFILMLEDQFIKAKYEKSRATVDKLKIRINEIIKTHKKLYVARFEKVKKLKA